jgi:hypothetical protein
VANNPDLENQPAAPAPGSIAHPQLRIYLRSLIAHAQGQGEMPPLPVVFGPFDVRPATGAASAMRPSRARGASDRRGLSFVEILVATALLVCVLLPVLYLFTQATRTSEVSLDELAATNYACELTDQLKVLPWSIGFRYIVQTPVPNPPPAFPEWTTLTSAGMGFPEADPNGPARLQPIDTADWTRTGFPYWIPPPDAPQIMARSRLYLSPLPENYRRKLKVYHPLADPSGNLDPNLYQIMVRIEWDRTFLGAPTQNRFNQMGTLIANPSFTL